MIIDNCTFKHNTAYSTGRGYGGGAIYVYTYGNANTIITNSKFIDNYATRGGAINYQVSATTVESDFKIYNCTFEDNSAEFGGCIQTVTSNLINTVIDNSTFINSAETHEIISINQGGSINNSIILNNGVVSCFVTVPASDFIADNNWWGSTSENYIDNSKFTDYATINNWLFLNAIILPSEIIVDDDVTIRFILQSYNPTTGEISDYDMSKIPKFILKLDGLCGNFDQDSALIGEEVIFHTKVAGKGVVKGIYDDFSYQANFPIKEISIITISNDTYERGVNKKPSLNLTDLATLSRSGEFKYELNDTSVAKIEDGKVKALKSGMVKLTISVDANEYYAANETYIIIIFNKDNPTIFYNNSNIDVGASKQLDYRLFHLAGGLEYDNDLTFESTNTSIVTVDENGIIKGISGGTAKIIIKYPGDDKYNAGEVRVTVTVNKIQNNLESNKTVSLEVGQSGLLEVIQDGDASLTFTCEDESIATVDSEGRITAVKGGVTKITIVSAENNKYLSNTTTVIVSVKKLSTDIDNEEMELTVDDTFNLSDLTNINGLTFKSNNTDVASVSENGLITAISGGVANITMSFNGNETHEAFNASLILTVKKLPSVITIENDVIYISVDGSTSLNPALSHEGNLNYEITNSSVIRYNETNKMIYGLIGGDTKIIVTFNETSRYEGAKKEVSVIVYRSYKTIDVNKTINIAPTDSIEIGATINIDGALLTYKSNDESIAIVDENGKITALREGEVNITVYFDGDAKYRPYSRNSTIIVKKIEPEITANDITLLINETYDISADLNNELKFTYLVGNSSIISISDKGIINPIKSGKTNVTIMFEGNDKYVALNKTISVTVNKMDVSINTPSEVTLKVGETLDLTQYIGVKDLQVSFDSNDWGIAYVENGILKAVSAKNYGSTSVFISVTGNEKYNSKIESFTVRVEKLEYDFNIEDETIEMDINQVLNIKEYFNIDAEIICGCFNQSVIVTNNTEFIKAINLGTAKVSIIFNGNDTHKNKTIYLTATVKKISSNITSEDALEVNIGQTKDLNAVLNHEGALTYSSNDTSIVTVDDNGQIKAIKAGSAKITIKYTESDNYTGCEKEVIVTVKKYDAEITVADSFDLIIDDEKDINAQTSSDGTLTYESSNSSVVKVENGKLQAISEGSATITITLSETNNYNGNVKTITVKVSKKQSQIKVNESFTLTVEDTTNLEAVLTPNTGTLTYLSNNPDIVSVDSTGKITALAGGSATITITYEGDSEYSDATATVNVVVNKVSIPNSDTAIDLNNPAETKTPTYSISLPADATGNLTVEVNGKTYTVPVVNGTASITVPQLPAGEYDVVVNYSGDSKYPSISKKSSIYVPLIKIAKNKNINMIYTSNTKYTVQVTKDSQALAGVYVTFNVNGKVTKVKTDNKGYASVKINLLPRAKVYKVTAEYNGVKVTNNVKVKDIITAKNIKTKKTKKVLKIKVSLKKVNNKYLKGKKLKLKFKGKTYTAKTNKKGVATFSIKKNVLKKLKAGKKYTYKVTYLKNTVSKKITIKK